MGNEESRIYSIKSDTRENKYPTCFSMLSSVKKSMMATCGGLSDTIDEDSIDMELSVIYALKLMA